jgi:hypothetical protein
LLLDRKSETNFISLRICRKDRSKSKVLLNEAPEELGISVLVKNTDRSVRVLGTEILNKLKR